MDRYTKPLALGAVALALGALVIASDGLRAARPAEGMQGPDLVPPASQLRMTRGTVVKAAGSGAPTVEDVGDIDSFGRNLTWLGVTNGFTTLAPSCDPASTTPCQVLAPSPGATSFGFTDIARIALPAKASHSLLCYWYSPVLTVNYRNDTASPVVARLTINPTLTVENPVLADPALIDPTTGAPFGGRLQTAMSSFERFEAPLPAGVGYTERTRDSAVCIAGFITRRNLIDGFGLTPAQADEFFKKPMTVRLNVSGTAQHVGFASMIFGLRIIGD